MTQNNEDAIRGRLRGLPTNERHMRSKKKKKKTKPFRFHEGDRVRIAKEKSKFEKGYLPNFQQEVFAIHKVVPRYPVEVYRIKDLDGEDIQGIFYPTELVPAV